MKTSKSNLSVVAIIVVVLFMAGTISSCSTKSSTEQTEEGEEAEGHVHDSTEAQSPHHEVSGGGGSTDSIMWMPSEQPFSGQLKLVEGDAQKLNAATSSDSDDSKVLSLSLSGERVLLLFEGTFEDLGSNLQFKTDGYQGQVAIVHHYTDSSNYEYLSLSNTSMQLGRIENGKDKIFNKEGQKLPGDWATLTVSSAGEHYKGLLNGKLVNHGHGETRPGGRVGILLEGKGKVMLKMMDVMKLTE